MDPDIREEYQQIDAVSATGEMAALLKIEERDSLLSVRRLFIDSAGQPVVFFKTNFRADRYYYTVQLPSARERNGTRQGGKGKKPATSSRPKPPA